MKRLIFSALFLFFVLIAPKVNAAMDPETRVQLDRMEREIVEIKQTQQQILEGQKKEAEEIQQLRYWIYRK